MSGTFYIYFIINFVQCETVYNTVYDDKCTVVTEKKCETSYETVYEQGEFLSHNTVAISHVLFGRMSHRPGHKIRQGM